MNIIKTLFVALLVSFVWVVGNLSAASRYDGTVWVEAPASSGSIAGYSRGCTVVAVYASSNTESTISNFFVLIATNPVAAGAITWPSFADSTYRSPAMFFPVSTTTANSGYMPQPYKLIDYGNTGLVFSTAPYVIKTAPTSGQANRVWLEIIP